MTLNPTSRLPQPSSAPFEQLVAQAYQSALQAAAPYAPTMAEIEFALAPAVAAVLLMPRAAGDAFAGAPLTRASVGCVPIAIRLLKAARALPHRPDICTRRHYLSHQREPRGRGGWLFENADREVVFSHSGLYVEARRAAIAWASARGVDRLYVCS